MTELCEVLIEEANVDGIAELTGRVVVLVPETGKLDQMARRVNRLMRGALERFIESDRFGELKPGQAVDLAFPGGMAADVVQVVLLDRRAKPLAVRRAGAAIAKAAINQPVSILTGPRREVDDLLLGILLRGYAFLRRFSDEDDAKSRMGAPSSIKLLVPNPDDVADQVALAKSKASGVYLTRDLINEPANVLTTTAFADQLSALKKLGVRVTVLEEPELAKLGMRALLAVGQGSQSPSKVVIMEWSGGGVAPPLALVGKGVVFDTGGISLKPAGGMEEMTMDMGGAGTVAGVMKLLAMRKAAANIVGIVGLVENMPDGNAQRPGDVVASMKGDTIEVINTDAEGRLVLADVLWYVQEKFQPRGIIDLATLTGAIVIALGDKNAGVFGNDDSLTDAFLNAAKSEGEGAWRMPLDTAYDRMLESRLADMKNSTGRPAGAVTAAKFLQRFIKEDMPWIHLDIAGVASIARNTTFSRKGATGWGVLTLDRLIADRYED